MLSDHKPQNEGPFKSVHRLKRARDTITKRKLKPTMEVVPENCLRNNSHNTDSFKFSEDPEVNGSKKKKISKVVNANSVTRDYSIGKVVRQVLSKMDSKAMTVNVFKRNDGMDEKVAELEAAIEKLNELRKQFDQELKKETLSNAHLLTWPIPSTITE